MVFSSRDPLSQDYVPFSREGENSSSPAPAPFPPSSSGGERYVALEEYQIREHLNQLEYRGVWSGIISFLDRYFGPAAMSVRIGTDYDSDDDQYEYFVTSITVYNADGKEIAPDLSLTAWSDFAARSSGYYEPDLDSMRGEIEDNGVLDDLTEYDLGRDAVQEEIPTARFEFEGHYYRNQPPHISYPELYAKVTT